MSLTKEEYSEIKLDKALDELSKEEYTKICICCGGTFQVENFRGNLCYKCAGVYGYDWDKGN